MCISSLQLSAAAFISVTSFGFEMPIISSISSSISAISTPQICHMLSRVHVKTRVRFDIGFQVTRVFLSLAFSTARHGARLRAFSRLSLFPLPGTAPDYARFLASRFFHCPARGQTTRVFLSLAFSTAWHGAGLRAFSCL